METKLVIIGNSQGVRLPKAVLEQAGLVLEQPLTIEVRSGSIVLTPIEGVRHGWAEAAREAGAQRDELWGDLPPAALVDEEWTW